MIESGPKRSNRLKILTAIQIIIVILQGSLIGYAIVQGHRSTEVLTIFFSIFLVLNILVLRALFLRFRTMREYLFAAFLFQAILGYLAIFITLVGVMDGNPPGKNIEDLYGKDLALTVGLQIILYFLIKPEINLLKSPRTIPGGEREKS